MSNDPRWFTTTHWSTVLAAGESPSAGSSAALERLCQTYWQPLYVYARRLGRTPDEAQDLTQAFFARLLEKRYLRAADPERGRFRSFLLTAFKHFVSKEWRHDHALKRGGNVIIAPLEIQRAEETYRLEPADSLTPRDVFEKRWALALLEQVFARLRREYESAGRLPLFEQLKGLLTGDTPGRSHSDIAMQLGMTPGAVKVAVCRLRGRFRDALTEEVAATVESPAQVEEEIGYMLDLMSR